MRTIFGLPVLFVSLGLAMPAMAQQDLSESNIKSGAPAAPRTTYKANPPPVAIPGATSHSNVAAPARESSCGHAAHGGTVRCHQSRRHHDGRVMLYRAVQIWMAPTCSASPHSNFPSIWRAMTSHSCCFRSAGPMVSEILARRAHRLTMRPLTPAQRRKADLAARAEARAEARAQTVAARSRAVATPAPAPTKQGAALFAGNGGAAVPSAGFLGFDPHK